FVDYWTYKLADLLLVTRRKLTSAAVQTYYDWIHSHVAENTAWDKMVREILTAKGNSLDQGEVNFFSIHRSCELQSENACQAFMGLSIGCAKCHNHPLEKWTNDQYYAMANLFARTRAKGGSHPTEAGDGQRFLVVADTGELLQPNSGKPQPPAPLDAAPLAAASFLDTLSQHAFGNFRDLLEAVTLHPAMGTYLSHLGNDKENTATGRMPDENYAREVMQLFTIGLWELNEDGTRRQQNGQDIPTYGQPEVMGMAKVFTGWSWAGPDTNEGRWLGWVNGVQTQPWDQPMQPYPQHHSTSEKRILRGVVIPAGTGPRESLEIALDTLFNHPNVGPFIGRQLIQRLVTSNPSPAYIARVARAFNNNGAGVRGDMKAVIRAVLLDPEARDAAKLADGNWGKLREPVVRVAN
ncbi:MAG: DUF1800 family protein, partial [Dechloromonas sp.]|nr:DUF1800 family protein [Dechloromonas sp.]